MKVGVLGSGDVAKTLAGGFLKHGHTVKVGSRSPGKLADWSAKAGGSSVGTFAEAAEFGELVVLAVKGDAAAEALTLAGAKNLAGKTVIDACNPIENAPPDSNQCGRPATPYPEERMAATIPGDDYGGDSQTRGEGTSSFAPSRTGPRRCGRKRLVWKMLQLRVDGRKRRRWT